MIVQILAPTPLYIDVHSQRVLRSVDSLIMLAWIQRRIQQICDKFFRSRTITEMYTWK